MYVIVYCFNLFAKVRLLTFIGLTFAFCFFLILFISDLRQVGGFMWWNIVESGIKHHKPSEIYWKADQQDDSL